MSERERRRTPRLNAEHPIKIIKTSSSKEVTFLEAHSLDINLNGLYCRTTHPLDLYSKVSLTLSLPIIGGNGEIKYHDINVEAMVVRIDSIMDECGARSYSIAFSFIDPSDRVDLIIGKYILQNILFHR
ncbi:MAG: PilZ domain-containing protein [Candidatus Coatesbacteria bacterium]|nr:PilZ domain-containing protein [Candidatus Coatesbacteria bacterium]